MARLTDDDFSALQRAMDDDTARALGGVRRADGARRNEDTGTWLAAGDTLAEKAIAALDTGDDAKAAKLVRRIIGLPVVDEQTRSGLMAVNLVLYNEVSDPDLEDDSPRGLLDLPLRLLPQLEPHVADELRHVLSAMTDFRLPSAVERRIRRVVPADRKFDVPFAEVPEAELPEVLTGVLRLVLRLRSAEG